MKLSGIIATIVIIAIVFYMWKQGLFAKWFGGSGAFKPHYTPIPFNGKYVKVSVAYSATELYNALKGISGDVDKVLARYNALPNDDFIAVYDGFNQMYEQGLGHTLRQEIGNTSGILSGAFGAIASAVPGLSVFAPSRNALREGIVMRLKALNCI